MKKIKAKPLTRENFRKYGDFQNLFDKSGFGFGIDPGSKSEFWPDVLTMNLGTGAVTSFGMACLEKTEAVINMIEYHKHTCEGVLPLDTDCIIFAGCSLGDFPTDELEAFIVPKGTLVRYNPGVLHGSQFLFNSEKGNIMIILPERTYVNDMNYAVLDEADQILVEV